MALAPTEDLLSSSEPEVSPSSHQQQANVLLSLTDGPELFLADKVCPAAVTSHSTTTPQRPEYSQGQKVTVRCDLGYVLINVSDQ